MQGCEYDLVIVDRLFGVAASCTKRCFVAICPLDTKLENVDIIPVETGTIVPSQTTAQAGAPLSCGWAGKQVRNTVANRVYLTVPGTLKIKMEANVW